MGEVRSFAAICTGFWESQGLALDILLGKAASRNKELEEQLK